MKRAIIICLLAGAIPCAWALDNAVINEWLGQQAWFDQCRKSVPFPQVGPRINKSLKECVDAGRSKDECEPLAMRANLLWINANTPHWVQCYENNLPPKIAACANKARIEDLECKLKLDTGERQRCAGPVIEKRYACLADHVKADIAKTPLIRDPLKVSLPSGITLHDWIVEARQRASKAEEAQALLDETTAHMRAYGAHPDLVALRDKALDKLVSSIRLGSEDEARQAILKLGALQQTAGNTPGLLQRLGRAHHLSGNFDKARQAYSALLLTMKPDAQARKLVVAALGQIEKREKPNAQAMPPEAYAAYAYLKTELAAAHVQAKPANNDPGLILSALVTMGEHDEALAFYEQKALPSRVRGEYDTTYAAAQHLVAALIRTENVEAAERFIQRLPHDPDNKYGLLSLKKGAYSTLVAHLWSTRHFDEARRHLAELDAEKQKDESFLIEFFETGADKDIEKAFRLASRGANESFNFSFQISEEALGPDKVTSERLMEMARQLPKDKWGSNGPSMRLLFKAGLCEQGKTFFKEKNPAWYEYASCLVRKGDLPGAEAVLDQESDPSTKSSIALNIGLVIKDPWAAAEWTARKMGKGWKHEDIFRLDGGSNYKYRGQLLKEGRYAEYWQLAQSYPNISHRIAAAHSLVVYAWQVANGKQ